MDNLRWNRLALICGFVEKRARVGDIGRTAVMKLAYLLKEIKGVSLGYRFTLYTYGPFDAQVLDDLRYAETLGAVESALEQFPGGYGYRFAPGPKIEDLKRRARDFLTEHDDEIAAVVTEFGGRSAAELEMISTIIFVDRSAHKRQLPISTEKIAAKVIDVKPHLNLDVVQRETELLDEKGYLKAVAARPI